MMSFEKAYNEFLIYATRRHKKQYLDTINQIFNKHILPYFKGKDIKLLTCDDYLNWQDSILNYKFSNNYNSNIYHTLNSYLKFCNLKYNTINYLAIIGPFPHKTEILKYNVYSVKQYKKFRKGLKNMIYRYFYDLLFYYGLRSGEAMALNFSDIKGNYLHINKNISRRGSREITSVKSDKSNRILKLDLKMKIKFLILKTYYCKKFGESIDYYIFGGINPLSPTSCNRYKHNACLNTGMFEIKNHEFRHSYATRMCKKKDIKEVSDSLGHSSVSITYDIYVHKEKRQFNNCLPSNNFFNTINQIFKKLLLSIITHFV